jgi:uncharacterized protein YndB with AHSA1/START domain
MSPSSDSRTLILEREMRYPLEAVWAALTDGRLIEQWLMKNDFQLEAGRRFHLRTAPLPHWDGIVDCEVMEVDAPGSGEFAQLAYTWKAAELSTLVTWTLTPTPAGVRVRMQQSGFLPEDENGFESASYAWQRRIAALEESVA